MVGRDAEVRSNATITIWGDTLEVVSEFKFLPLTEHLKTKIAHHVASASSPFACLRKGYSLVI